MLTYIFHNEVKNRFVKWTLIFIFDTFFLLLTIKILVWGF